jgi:hypothetical protein
VRKLHDLSQLDWTLTGWHPNVWRFAASPGVPGGPEVAAIPARVPGSVQGALRDAGLIPDWNVGLNSRQCEWVENRDWMFEAELPGEWIPKGGRARLKCDGLDYQGVVLVNGRQAGRFRGTHVPHVFDLTRRLTAQGSNRLTLVFTEIPRYLGQIGYTSKVREWKTRFNYVWDWVPRIVQIGVWDQIRLEVQHGDAINTLSLYPDYDHRAQRGAIVVGANLALARAERIEIIVAGDDGEVARRCLAVEADFRCRVDGLRVRPWHPNGNGEQRLYTVHVRLLDRDGAALDQETVPLPGLRPPGAARRHRRRGQPGAGAGGANRDHRRRRRWRSGAAMPCRRSRLPLPRGWSAGASVAPQRQRRAAALHGARPAARSRRRRARPGDASHRLPHHSVEALRGRARRRRAVAVRGQRG